MGVGKTGFKMSGSGLKIREIDWSGLQMSGTGGGSWWEHSLV